MALNLLAFVQKNTKFSQFQCKIYWLFENLPPSAAALGVAAAKWGVEGVMKTRLHLCLEAQGVFMCVCVCNKDLPCGAKYFL